MLSRLVIAFAMQVLKDDAMKVLQSICQQIWKTQQCPQDWKRSVFISSPPKRQCHISHASKVMLKILHASLQQYVNHELTEVQAGFRKVRGTRNQIANIRWIMKKPREFQKNVSSASLVTLKPMSVWMTANWKILKEMGAFYRNSQ